MELYTNGSRLRGVGYVLIQNINNKTYFIKCGRPSLNQAQLNYSTIQIELQACSSPATSSGTSCGTRTAQGIIAWCNNLALVRCSTKDFTLNKSPSVVLMFEK